MAKKLKIWNGRGWPNGPDHLYVCETSRAAAARLLMKAGHTFATPRELKIYFCEGAWGNTMNGITPEIGVWATYKRSNVPVRLI